MGTDKRDRQKANRAAKAEAERAANVKARRIQTIRNVVITAVVLIVLMVLFSTLTSCAKSDSASDGASSTDETTTTVPGDPGEPAYGTGECPPTDGSAERTITFDDAPQLCIDPDKTYTATFETTEGTFVVELDTERTPLTTNNFVTLARWGYYDGTDLFRTEAFSGILQGGSAATQDNSDPGPGYEIPDEGIPYTSADYGPGTLAMARTQMPNSASSQFFLLANENGAYLGDPAQGASAGTYVPFGTTVEGLDVLQAIADLESVPGTATSQGSGTPSKQVTIEKLTIDQSTPIDE